MTMNAGACRFIDQCLACVQAGCIWLQKTLVPCRSSLDDVEIRPITVATGNKDCFKLLRNEESNSVEYGKFRGKAEGLDWRWAMTLCVVAAFAFAIGARYRHFKATPGASWFRRH